MMTFESRKSRRLIVRLDKDEELVGSLESLARRESISAAWVRGMGSLAWIELDRHDQGLKRAEPPQRFDTPAELLTLEGNLSMDGTEPRARLHATIARRTDNGVDVIGGRVRSAGVFACELVVEVFADLTLSRAPDLATGLSLLTGGTEQRAPSTSWTTQRDEPKKEEAPASKPASGGISWADVAAVSAAPPVSEPPRLERPSRQRPTPPAPSRYEEPEEYYPERGDYLDHRQFGLCRIDREDDEGGLIIRLPSGVRKVIKLDFMEVGKPRMEGSKRVFPIRPRKR